MFTSTRSGAPGELVELDPVALRTISGGNPLNRLVELILGDFVGNYQCFKRGFREALRG